MPEPERVDDRQEDLQGSTWKEEKDHQNTQIDAKMRTEPNSPQRYRQVA
jgi:hypothetical protein